MATVHFHRGGERLLLAALFVLWALPGCSDGGAATASNATGAGDTVSGTPDGGLTGDQGPTNGPDATGDQGAEDAGPDVAADTDSPADIPVQADNGPDDASASDAAEAMDAAADAAADQATADEIGDAPALDCGPSCDDGAVCTLDSCNPTTGVCEHTLAPGQACEDGEPCTAGDKCDSQGQCQAGGLALECECLTTADCAAKGRSLACNGFKYCKKTGASSACVTNLASVIKCAPSGDPCKPTLCVEDLPEGGAGCALGVAPTGTACDDGVAWTVGDICDNGVCTAGTDTAPCLSDADCAKVDDQNLCDGTLFCNKALAACAINPKTVVVCPTVDDTLCAKNQCQPKTGQCLLLPVNDGKSCDDGDPCTQGEACDSGACQASAGANVCACKQDSDCAKLEDGDKCNGVMYCDKAAATCKLNPTTIVNCPSAADTDCTKNLCDKLTGACKPTWLPNATPCNADNSACTPNDVCVKGVCVADAPLCECQVDQDCAVKEDGNPCNGTLYCNKLTKACEVNPATVVTCPTAFDTECTKNTCMVESGKCQPQPLKNQTPCSDDNACTQGDTCDGKGTCVSGTPFCDCLTDSDCPDLDKEPCNGIRYCDKVSAPYKCKDKPGSVMPEKAPCDDGTACTADDTCQGGVCTGGKVSCEDSNPCTDDACSPTGGCVHLANEATCTDGNSCTVGDGCGASKCIAGKPNSCDDGKACTVDACDPTAGCMHANVDQPCTDGDACTVGDTCKDGNCIAGLPAACTDATVCTTDSCNPQTGCEHLLNQGPCTDDNPCTQGDKCNGMACVPGPTVNCDDGEQCTADSCDDVKGGCKHSNLTTCNDNNACTTGDACATVGGKWTCNSYGVVNCDDGNECTNDACDTIKGCGHVNNTFSKDCYTGPANTVGKGLCKYGKQTCSGGSFGACTGQVTPVGETCDGYDQNCDGTVDNGVNCSDGNACTSDACVSGKCQNPAVANNTTWAADWQLCVDGKAVAVDGNNWVTVAKGTYTLGCISGDALCVADEKPQHNANFNSFQILATEVTVAQYLKCVQAGKCPAPNTTDVTSGCDNVKYPNAPNWLSSGPRTDRYDHPVNCVNWSMALDYCNYITPNSMTASIPSEGQFEVAQRGGFLNKYTWSNNFPPGNITGNLCDVTGQKAYPTMPSTVSATWSDGWAATCPVRSFPANGYGLYGTTGNVAEWTEDFYSATFYNTSASTAWDPVCVSGSGRSLRGGSWWCGAAGGATLYRASYRGTHTVEGTVGTANGFRCVK